MAGLQPATSPGGGSWPAPDLWPGLVGSEVRHTAVDPTEARLRNDLAQQRRTRCETFYSEKPPSRPLSAEADGSARHPP